VPSVSVKEAVVHRHTQVSALVSTRQEPVTSIPIQNFSAQSKKKKKCNTHHTSGSSSLRVHGHAFFFKCTSITPSRFDPASCDAHSLGVLLTLTLLLVFPQRVH
jgi:hypothetical protein